jgi:phosphohistidine phosphatase
MTSLFILRHGIAVPHGSAGIADSERPLTIKGEKRMRQVGRGLARLKLPVNRIATSPLPRAKRTAQIVAQELGMIDELDLVDILSAGADPHRLRDWLTERAEQRLMIVGHNPDLSDLVTLLVAGEVGKFPFELKKGGLACLRAGNASASLFQLDWTAPAAVLRRIR